MQDTTLALAVALPTGGISLLVLLAITCMKRKNSDSTSVKGAKTSSSSSSTAPLTSVTSASDSGALFGDKTTRNPLFDDDDVSLRRMSSAGSVQPPNAGVAPSDVIVSAIAQQEAAPAPEPVPAAPVPESAPSDAASAPSAEDRAAKLAAMRASRATKKVNEVTIIQDALRVLDTLDDE